MLGISAWLLASCALFRPQPPGIGEPLPFSALNGWSEDRHAEAWPALRNTCRRLGEKDPWQALCAASATLADPDNDQARRFFETWFTPHALHGEGGNSEGLVTGYYEPLLQGSLSPSDRYRFPLYARPDDLLLVDLGALYPELAGKRVRGRLEGRKVVPYYSREEIDSDPGILDGQELLWIDDRDDAFFLHIQGSGRVRLDDGREVGVGYSDQNGHPYVAIGKVLLENGELTREEISLFTIRDWLRDHPERAEDLLFKNPSYVFFVLRDDPGDGPVGSLNVPLTAQRSIAIDPKVVDLGTPIWLETNLPGAPDTPYRRLVMAQDTGGAIRGPIRGDLFWGNGEQAERMAGIMKERGRMAVLLPRSSPAD